MVKITEVYYLVYSNNWKIVVIMSFKKIQRILRLFTFSFYVLKLINLNKLISPLEISFRK